MDARDALAKLGNHADTAATNVNQAANQVNFAPAAASVNTAATDINASFDYITTQAGYVPSGIQANVGATNTAAQQLANAVTNPLDNVSLYSYGEHASSQWVSGLKDGASNLGSVANHWATLLENKLGFSTPPPDGPLHNLPQWGPHMIEAWLGPMVSHGKGRVESTARSLGALVEKGLAVSARAEIATAATATASRGHHWDVSNPDLPNGSRTAYNDEYHFHIGTLIANDAGLDELERRMERRARLRRRDRRLVGSPN